MSDQNSIPLPSSPPPARGTQGLTFFDLAPAKVGFDFRLEDKGPYFDSPSVMGFFQGFWLEWDPGRDAPRQQDRIEARWKLRVLLVDARTEDLREFPRAWLTVGPKSAFFGLAHGLLGCAPGQYVGVRVAKGDSACFVDVSTWDGQSWSGKQTPKSDGRDFADRYEETVELLKASPFYKEPERRSGDDGQAAPAPPQPAPQQQQPAAVQTSAPVATVPVLQQAAAEALAEPTEPDVVAPSPLPTAFGLQASRWVRSYTKPASEAQTAALASKGAAHGLADAALRNVAEAVLKAYEVPAPLPGKPLSSGYVTLVYDWLGAASAEQVEQARVASRGEYDPFADE